MSTSGLRTSIYPVDDLAAAEAVYTRLLGGPQDVGGGTVLAAVTDPEGNVVGLVQKP